MISSSFDPSGSLLRTSELCVVMNMDILFDLSLRSLISLSVADDVQSIDYFIEDEDRRYLFSEFHAKIVESQLDG